MAVTTLQAESTRDKSAVNLPPLTQLRINGVTPFTTNRDAQDGLIAEAHALLMLLAGVYDCAEDAGAVAADAFLSTRPGITARALEGIASLIALAQHFEDCEQAERQHRRQA
jgi:hypothetical protein